MKQTIKIYKGDEFMDYSGEARMIKVLDKHFDDYYVESFVPSFNEENDCDEWIRGGEFVMSAHDLTEIVRKENNLSDIRIVFVEDMA